ncbi:MAG: F0F1 ATP synthase subunit A [Candidatus Paracaedibacteraceae bacterium]|nr:F0F1 ATP synthase subunit A [Candidatus Paracaedibacteraceae bacterium]
MAHSPLHQFQIMKLIPLKIAGIDISFTNSSLWMVITAITLCLFGHLATRKASIVPNRLQYTHEAIYTFVADMLKTNLGREGRTFFPFVFPLFLFILMANLVGLLPYSFTVTSHIIVTFALAMIVFLGATTLGIIKHKSGFLRTFFPKGAPIFVAPILIPIEIISFLMRPVSLSVRLFANMVAGHVLIKIFAGFVTALLKSPFALFGIVPLLLNSVMLGFEVMVAVLQAYVFTILTCIYINDALSLH